MGRRLAIPIAILWVAAALLGCSSSEASTAPSDGGPSPTAIDPMLTPITGCPLPPAGKDAMLLDLLVADAACRANVSHADVSVERFGPATWSDGSLGCPQPGMVYTQAEVEGWEAIVNAGSMRLDYRIRGPGQYLICENPPG